MSRRTVSIGLFTVALLGGCAVLAPSDVAMRTYSGRFAANIDRDGMREAASGRFTMEIYRERTTLDLASPLGNTLARIESGADGATLKAPQADGTLATWRGPSADALAESVLGYGLPVSGLSDWITGRPTPGRPSRVLPEAGPAQRIEQDGWIIVIDERFEESGAPRRLSLERIADAPMSTSLQVRLVLDTGSSAIPDRQHQ